MRHVYSFYMMPRPSPWSLTVVTEVAMDAAISEKVGNTDVLPIGLCLSNMKPSYVSAPLGRLVFRRRMHL